MLLLLLIASLPAAPDAPTVVVFPIENARFVRVIIWASNSGSEPCLDELEVYGEDPARDLALAATRGKATASSCLPGYAIHQVKHLNDGEFGNAHSWIAAGTRDEWAQIELPKAVKIQKVVLSRDRSGAYGDRIPTSFEILLSLDGKRWKSVKKVTGQADRSSEAVPEPPPVPVAAQPPREPAAEDEVLREAFLGEEHAWLKTYGQADISPALVPYNGRVKEYPRHVDDDRLPLPPLSTEPKFDGNLNDPCWKEASRGTVRVAFPYDPGLAPLVRYELSAGGRDGDLFLAIRTERLLSGHVAVVSSTDGQGYGVVLCTNEGLAFNTYIGKGKVAKSTRIESAHDAAYRNFEIRLPLTWFPDCKEQGLRIGLGIGGKHTSKLGRPVNLVFSSLAVAEERPCVSGTFRVRLAACGKPVTIKGNAPGLEEGVRLAAGQSRNIAIAAKLGPIGPEYVLNLSEDDKKPYVLHLFRYDPVERVLTLHEQLIERLAAKGLEVRAERDNLAALRSRQDALMSAIPPEPAAERRLFYEARMAKRRLFFREPDLEPLARILFVKRHPFQPSHNYSDYFDAPFRPGGGVCLLDIPRRDGRFEPGEARLTELFHAQGGIARNSAATFDLSRVYFGYRPSENGYYHLMRMSADGSALTQITDGPFHDFWPCPLPDGGLAFVSTRCASRVFCWRPQASVLFRMDADEQDIRPISLANLTEWAPSVMHDGRILWTRWEYLDKGADFGHTLWTIRPDGTFPELMFGNDIIQPNGYANGREVPNSREICCTLISHFGDLNGPIALLDIDKGRFNPAAIASLTPEVPWPGAPPMEECFREPMPLARDYFLCSHAPRDRFALFVIDRFGNRELVYSDPAISCMCPTIFQARTVPPVIAGAIKRNADQGEFILADVYRGLEPAVMRGEVKYLRVVEEVRHTLQPLPNGEYPKDHEPFMLWYASPDDKVTGPFGWPTYVAKASLGLVPVEQDGSAHFYAPAGKVLYFEALDQDFNELQRMRSVIQLQPGEKRGCIGCHESRQMAPVNATRPMAKTARSLDPPSWGTQPFAFEKMVQPVLDARCVQCHGANSESKVDFSATLDADKVPASYRTLITKGLVHYLDCAWNPGGCEKLPPKTFGTLKSKLWQALNAGHYGVQLTTDERIRIKTWIDLNCPLWPDYVERTKRPGPPEKVARQE